MGRRVVVTGIGTVSALGIGFEENWNALIEGKNGIARVTRFDDPDMPSQVAGEVKNFDPLVWIGKKDVKKMDLFIQYAIAASEFAMQDSGLKIDSSNADRTGVIIGSGIGGLPMIESQFQRYQEEGYRKVSPFFIPAIIINLASGQVSIRYGAKGPNSAACTACATSSHAIGDAFRIIQRGDADAMICGGAEAVITPLAFAGFCSMRALSTRNHEPEKASRPFDRDRDGFVMAEGSGIIVLEEMESALNRGAKIYAEFAGYGMTGDAYHISAPSEDADGAIRVMRLAIRDSGITPDMVDYINTHGTSTPAGDEVEIKAIKEVFGDSVRKLHVSSTKSMTGHLLGATGGFETAIMAKIVKEGIIPPTVNLDNPIDEGGMDFVPHKAIKKEIRYALNNSFGFGGTNACIALKRFEE